MIKTKKICKKTNNKNCNSSALKNCNSGASDQLGLNMCMVCLYFNAHRSKKTTHVT